MSLQVSSEVNRPHILATFANIEVERAAQRFKRMADGPVEELPMAGKRGASWLSVGTARPFPQWRLPSGPAGLCSARYSTWQACFGFGWTPLALLIPHQAGRGVSYETDTSPDLPTWPAEFGGRADGFFIRSGFDKPRAHNQAVGIERIDPVSCHRSDWELLHRTIARASKRLVATGPHPRSVRGQGPHLLSALCGRARPAFRPAACAGSPERGDNVRSRSSGSRSAQRASRGERPGWGCAFAPRSQMLVR